MKGYSERISNKNLKLFHGKPLFSFVLSTLCSSKFVDQVIVNTDSPKIAKLVSSFDKVNVLDRPYDICGDTVSMNKIIENDLKHSNSNHFLQTHSTNPLLSLESLNLAIKTYFENLATYDSLFSVTKHQFRLYYSNGEPLNHSPKELLRTQDLEPLFEENSCLYLFSKDSFLNSGGKRIGVKPSMFELNKLEAIDIDNSDDFDLAKAVYSLNLNK
tara:strand:- start:213 stop:857 length:645 start_codon:yes stop_codon:yes gene_type:complete